LSFKSWKLGGGRIEAAPSIRRIFDHSPLVLTIWGRTPASPTPTTYFDTTLLKEEESRSALLDAWTGSQPMPSQDAEWPAWLEAASGRVLQCNIKIARVKKRAKGASVATLTWPSVGVKPNTWKSWGFGVLRDSRMFRA